MNPIRLGEGENGGSSLIDFELLLIDLIQGIPIYLWNYLLGSFSEIALCTRTESLGE
jgi:hypothetical protein